VKEYPSIQAEVVHDPIYAFDKLDGSNIRAEWSRKNGFYKFGKRHGLVDETDPLLGEAKGLVLASYAEPLSKIFRDERWQQAVCFFEFHGPGSFAGNHAAEPHEVTLFDVAYEKKGFMEPKAFLKLFEGRVKIAPLLYHGNPNSTFVEAVRDRQLEGMTFEGVVCKGKAVSPGRPLMFKVKSREWIEAVKNRFAGQPDIIAKLL
jgi:hypothetical protein